MEKATTIADNLRLYANGKLRIPSKDCALIADLLVEFLNTPMAHLGAYPEYEQQVFLLCMQRLIELKQSLYRSYDLGRCATIKLDMAASIGLQLAIP
jgi:hypothetical protein